MSAFPHGSNYTGATGARFGSDTTAPGGTTPGTTSATVPGTSGTTPSTTTSTTSTTNSAANHRGEAAGEGVKGIFAKGHGIGESIRGNINSAIDSFTGDKASLAKNEQVAQGGEREFRTGQFEKRGTTDKAL